MRAPTIYVVVGHNFSTGSLFGWSFCRRDAEATSEALNREHQNEYATMVEDCEPIGEKCAEKHPWER